MVKKKLKVSLALFTASSYTCVHLESRTRVTKPAVPSMSCARLELNSCSTSLQEIISFQEKSLPDLSESFTPTPIRTKQSRAHTHTHTHI